MMDDVNEIDHLNIVQEQNKQFHMFKYSVFLLSIGRATYSFTCFS